MNECRVLGTRQTDFNGGLWVVVAAKVPDGLRPITGCASSLGLGRKPA